MSEIISLFSGAGGLDLGFHKAGFRTIWANEYDKSIFPTYRENFNRVEFDVRSISDIPVVEIPKASGVIGGPPCQSWSAAGARRGINDSRGRLFYDYLNVINHVQPKFFLAENVSGLIHERNLESFVSLVKQFEKAGYDVYWKLLNASDYQVPQDRKRVFIVGFRKDLSVHFSFPKPIKKKKTLKDAIYDLKDIPLDGSYPNHEITDTGKSSIFMSRNRVRSWNEQSYTLLAMDRHTPLHPQAPKMIDSGEVDKKIFVPGKEKLYRRLSIRECARIQTFPDKHKLIYTHPRVGYKMIGNAVPVKLSYHIARCIKAHLS